jgi:hypothetical protein
MVSNATFRFKAYSIPELDACGKEFVAAFNGNTNTSTKAWTIDVANWFRAAAAPTSCVYGKPHSSTMMLDQCHTTMPFAKHPMQMNCGDWGQALRGQCKLLLAFECEWGKVRQPDDTLCKILHDAWKLVIVRAKAKVMVFSSQDGTDRSRIVDHIKQLRDCGGDTDPMLWIDAPWNLSKLSPRNIDYALL